MPIKSFAVPAPLVPFFNALASYCGSPEAGVADFTKDGVYYALVVGEYPYDNQMDESLFDNESPACLYLAERGLEAYRAGEFLQSRAESVATAIESLGLTPCVVQDDFVFSPEPPQPPPNSDQSPDQP